MSLEELFIPLLMAGAIITAILMYAFRRYGRWLLLIILVGGTLVGTYLFFPQAGDWVTAILNDYRFWYAALVFAFITIIYYFVRPKWDSITRSSVIAAIIVVALGGAVLAVWIQWDKIRFPTVNLAPAEPGALVFWGIIIAVAIIILLYFTRYLRAAKAFTALVALALIAYLLAPSAPCFSEACVQAREIEAGKERIRQHIAAERRKEQELREEQRARRVARNPQCPGEVIRNYPLTGAWVQINPHGCDFSFRRKVGNIEFSGPSGSFSTTQVGGRADNRQFTYIRAQGAAAVIDYMLCPQGMGPEDGSSECRTYSPSVPYGLFNAIFGKH